MQNQLSEKTILLSANIPEDVLKAAEAMKNGNVIAFPTETVYGLGANALMDNCVREIFRVKNRPIDNPLIIHVGHTSQIPAYVKNISAMAQCLIDGFMPGPLTLVMKKKEIIPDIVSGGLDTVGIRIPAYPATQRLLQMCDFPVAAPSANLSGRPSGTTAKHVFEDFQGKIPYILDGGSCQVGIESTVVDVTGEYPVVLRPGMITEKMLLDCCKKKGIDLQMIKTVESDNLLTDQSPRAPGMKYRHYAPNIPVYIVYPRKDDRVHPLHTYLMKIKGRGGVFCSETERTKLCDLMHKNDKLPVFYTYSDGFENEVRELFAAFRFLEAQDLDYILVPGYRVGEDEREGAYMNRLKKASMHSDSPKKSDLHIKKEKNEKLIVFVCTGNTCRSPMTEAIFAEMIREKHFINEQKEPVVIRVQSAGTAVNFRSPANPQSIYAVKNLFQLNIEGHISQHMDRQLTKSADLILCLGKSNKKQLETAFPEEQRKIFSFADPISGVSVEGISGEDIPDPYGGGQELYFETARKIKERLQILLPRILDFLQIKECKPL